ncbi:MAG: hypothetical protein R3B49_09060 [Phycisphaerales bacterium]
MPDVAPEVVDACPPGQRCLFCGYDLVGQAVTLEPNFNLAIAACPECGRAQPAGRVIRSMAASRRRASVVTAAWVVLVLVTVFGSVGAVAGLAQSTGYAASVPLARFIALWHADHASRGGELTLIEPMEWNRIGTAWWAQGGRADVMGMLTWNRLVQAGVLTDLLWLLVICPPFALLWRAVFVRASRRSVICWFALAGFVGACALWSYLAVDPWGVNPKVENYAIYVAEAEVGVYVLWGSYALGLMVLGVSIWGAGAVLRRMIGSLGGPRLRAMASPVFEGASTRAAGPVA